MTSISPPGESATIYGLDALGRIASRTRPGEATETYGFIGSSETVWRIDDGTTVTEAAIDAAGSRIATKTGSSVGYALFDLHGSIAAVSDAATDIDTALRYDAWGELTAIASGSIPTPWRYQGLLDVSPDADNPLYDMGARFYAPGLGAFTQFDTYAGQAQNPLSMNRFLYAHANPATLVDPPPRDPSADVDLA